MSRTPPLLNHENMGAWRRVERAHRLQSQEVVRTPPSFINKRRIPPLLAGCVYSPADISLCNMGCGKMNFLPVFSCSVLLITLALLEHWTSVECKRHPTTGHSRHHHRHPSPPPPPVQYSPKWIPATATWYGNVDGAGTDGGACGYGSLESSAYGTMVSAGSPVLFKNGKGCGACYEVRCVGNKACSSSAVKVAITDECPGGYCAFGNTHFDMSGSAFSHMAISGYNSSLLNAGVLQVLYRRTPCEYPRGTDVEFVVNQGSSPYWFSVLIKYESGDGDLSQVELMQGNSGRWEAMYLLWGAYWCLNEGPLQGPFSLRLTSSAGHLLTATHVIPSNWGPGKVYKSLLNF